MDLLPSFPEGARAAFREFAAESDGWIDAYAALVAEIRREVRLDLGSFDPLHGWRGTAHRVILRNTYADIGITTGQGHAAIWLSERVDRVYRLRCEWIDLSADARRWLIDITPRFDAVALRLGFGASVPEFLDAPHWLKAA